jgi:hypothetical protein
MLAPFLIWTAMIQGPFAACVYRCTSYLAGSIALGVSIVAAVFSVAVSPIVLRLIFPDSLRHRPWSTHLVGLYLCHWTACGIATLFGLLAFIVQLLLSVLSLVPFVAPSTIACLAYALSLAFCLYGMLIRRNWPLVRHHSFTINGLAKGLDGYRIVHITDLHIGSFARKKLADRWASLINAQNPDLIVVTGDLISSGDCYFDEVQAFLSSIHAPDGVVVSPGNHDYFGHSQRLFEFVTQTGAIILRNQSRTICRAGASFALVGLDDPCTRRANLPLALRSANGVSPVIALAHDPDIFPQCAEHHVALTLSGHTHGGQLAIPGLARWISIKSFSAPFPLGVYSRNGSFLVVGGGLGTSGPPVRIGVAPEIAVICLRA